MEKKVSKIKTTQSKTKSLPKKGLKQTVKIETKSPIKKRCNKKSDQKTVPVLLAVLFLIGTLFLFDTTDNLLASANDSTKIVTNAEARVQSASESLAKAETDAIMANAKLDQAQNELTIVKKSYQNDPKMLEDVENKIKSAENAVLKANNNVITKTKLFNKAKTSYQTALTKAAKVAEAEKKGAEIDLAKAFAVVKAKEEAANQANATDQVKAAAIKANDMVVKKTTALEQAKAKLLSIQNKISEL